MLVGAVATSTAAADTEWRGSRTNGPRRICEFASGDDITDSINMTHNLFRMFVGILVVEDAMIDSILHVRTGTVNATTCAVAHL